MALLALAGCRTAPPSLDGIAEGYVRAALQLAQHQPSLVDGFHGPDEWRPGAREPVAGIRARIASLRSQLAAARQGGDDLRAAYLDGQLGALDLAARRLLGETFPFADEVRLALGVTWTPPAADELASHRQALESLLPGAGPLVDRYRAFRREAALPDTAIEQTFADALETCRAVTRAHLALPAGERVTLAWVDQGPWEAYARDAGGLATEIRVARGGAPTAAHVAHVACHEGYPGHHVQHVLIATALVADRGWLEFTLAPAFGPHLLVAEGAAEAGARLALGEAAATDRATAIEAAVAGLDQAIPPIVAAYLDGELGTEAAAARLADEALVPDPEGFLVFAERARARAVAYPIGRRLVAAALERDGPGDQWARLAALFSDTPFHLE